MTVMLTKKTRYALMALTTLAKAYGDGPVPMSRIADDKNIPLRFLEGILLQLKRAGIVESTRGIDGGYALKRPPETITLSEIIRATGESVSFVSCLACSPEEGCEFGWDREVCGIRKVFTDIYDAIQNKMSATTLNVFIDC